MKKLVLVLALLPFSAFAQTLAQPSKLDVALSALNLDWQAQSASQGHVLADVNNVIAAANELQKQVTELKAELEKLKKTSEPATPAPKK